MVLSGILIRLANYIRFTNYIKRNDDTLWYYQVFSYDLRITFDLRITLRETMIRCGIVRNSHSTCELYSIYELY